MTPTKKITPPGFLSDNSELGITDGAPFVYEYGRSFISLAKELDKGVLQDKEKKFVDYKLSTLKLI